MARKHSQKSAIIIAPRQTDYFVDPAADKFFSPDQAVLALGLIDDLPIAFPEESADDCEVELEDAGRALGLSDGECKWLTLYVAHILYAPTYEERKAASEGFRTIEKPISKAELIEAGK